VEELEPADRAIERVLIAAWPAADPAWVQALEERLLAPATPARAWTVRRLGLGLAFALGLAVLAAGLSLAGVGPFAGRSGSVSARDDCRTVAITRVEPVPTLVTGADGQPRLVYRDARVTHRVRRC
jgi:hypothetical protein